MRAAAIYGLQTERNRKKTLMGKDCQKKNLNI
jgi:hypothetical protein